jgi:hypothetical protein
VATRPRGLCWTDYRRPEIRDLYPASNKFGQRGHGTGNRIRPAPFPIDAEPGTEAKIKAMEERAKDGCAIFHPADRVIDLH